MLRFNQGMEIELPKASGRNGYGSILENEMRDTQVYVMSCIMDSYITYNRLCISYSFSNIYIPTGILVLRVILITVSIIAKFDYW